MSLSSDSDVLEGRVLTPQPEQKVPSEKNFTWTLEGCSPPGILSDKDKLVHGLKRSLQLAGIDTYGGFAHKFAEGGEGVTLVEIVGYSCGDIHTWPEYDSAVVRCFACGDKEKQVREFIRHLRVFLSPTRVAEAPVQEIFVQLPAELPRGWKLI